MTIPAYSLTHLTDQQLLGGLARVNRQSQQLSAQLLAHLAEVDGRHLYLKHACSSLFTFCVERLFWSEDTTYKRVQAARVAQRFPLIFELMAKGDVHLSAVTLLAPHLTAENHRELLEAARHQSKRQVEALVASQFPRPDVAASLRKLPAPPEPGVVKARPAEAASLAGASAGRSVEPTIEALFSPPTAGATALMSRRDLPLSPARAVAPVVPARATPNAPTPIVGTPSGGTFTLGALPEPARAPAVPSVAILEPLSSERYRLQVTLGRESRDKLLQAQALLRHQQPDGDLAAVIDRALTALVNELERRRFGKRRRKAGAERGDGASGGKLPAKSPAPGQATAAVSRSEGELAPPLCRPKDEPARGSRSGDHPAQESRPSEHDGLPGAAAPLSSETAALFPDRPSTPASRPSQNQLRSRHIPNEVRRVVAERDGGRCTFVGVDGQRCSERGFLELHHDEAFAKGGASNIANVRLVCRAHNGHLAERDFGAAYMEAKRGAKTPRRVTLKRSGP